MSAFDKIKAKRQQEAQVQADVPTPQSGDLFSGGVPAQGAQPIDLSKKNQQPNITGGRAFMVNAANAGTAGFLPDIANSLAKQEQSGVQFNPEAIESYLSDPNVSPEDKAEMEKMIGVTIGFGMDPGAGHNMRKELALAAKKKPLISAAGNMAGTTALGMAASPIAGESALGQVALDTAQAASMGYNSTENKSPKNAAIAGLTQMGMSGGMQTGNMIGKKMVPALEDFYFGTPTGKARTPYTTGRRTGFKEGSKEIGPVNKVIDDLGAAPWLKSREGFIEKKLEPANAKEIADLDAIQRGGDWDAQVAGMPEPSRLRLADRLMKIVEEMQLSADPQYTSTGNEIRFYVDNVLVPNGPIQKTISRAELRNGAISSPDNITFHTSASGNQTKLNEPALGIIRDQAKRLYHESISSQYAAAEQASRDTIAGQKQLLDNMRAAEGTSPFEKPFLRWANKPMEGMSGTLANMLKLSQGRGSMPALGKTGEAAVNFAAPLATTKGGARIGSIISQMLQQDPKDQATDHYVMYHNDPEYRKLYDEAVGMSTNE